MIDYAGRRFRSVANSGDGQVNEATVFEYRHEGDVVWATYSGGEIRHGTLVATVASDGCLDMRYQHVDAAGTIATGRCHSTPVVLEDGRLQMNEVWEWTSGQVGSGTSVVQEVR